MRTSKKVGHRDADKTVITTAQFQKTVGADLTYVWFPVNERPTVDVSASREGINLLGALTETGETMFLECTGSFIKEVTTQFLQALQSEFGEEPVVVLDTDSYFTANKVREFVEGTERATLSPDRNGEVRSNRGVLATAENSTREQILRFA